MKAMWSLRCAAVKAAHASADGGSRIRGTSKKSAVSDVGGSTLISPSCIPSGPNVYLVVLPISHVVRPAFGAAGGAGSVCGHFSGVVSCVLVTGRTGNGWIRSIGATVVVVVGGGGVVFVVVVRAGGCGADWQLQASAASRLTRASRAMNPPTRRPVGPDTLSIQKNGALLATHQHIPLATARVGDVSWLGMACGYGTGYGIPRSTVPSATLGMHWGNFCTVSSAG